MNETINNYGLSGLRNIGNTCYMNATLQCLAHTDVLCLYFLKGQFFKSLCYNKIKNIETNIRNRINIPKEKKVNISKIDIEKSIFDSVTYQMYRVFRALWSENCVVRPSELKKTIDRHLSLEGAFAQNCSHDLLVQLFDKINDENKEHVAVRYLNVHESIVEYKNKYENLKHKLGMLNELVKKNENDLQTFERNECSVPLLDKDAIFSFDIDKIKSNIEAINRSLYNIALDDENFIEKIHYMAYNDWQQYICKDNSIIKEHFSWQNCQFIQCTNCDNLSITFDKGNTFMVSLPMLDMITLYDAFAYELRKDELKGDNAYKCDNCNKYVTANISRSIWQLPDVLIVTLKRFYEKRKDVWDKYKNKVVFPFDDLDLSKLHFNDRKCCKYNLYAIIEHYGSPIGGHYIAYCKNMGSDNWFKYDDADVTFISDIKSAVNLREYFMLFYQKTM